MSFRRVSTYLSDVLGFSAIADGLATVEVDGFLRLLFAHRDTGEIGSINLGPSGQAPTAQGLIADQNLGPDLEVQNTSSGVRIYVSPASFSPSRVVTLASDGTANPSASLTATDGELTSVRAMAIVEFGSVDVALVSRHGVEGFAIYSVSDKGIWTRTGTAQDGLKTHLLAVTSMTTVDMGEHKLIVTTSALEDGVTVLEVKADGTVSMVDAISAREGLWASGPSGVEVLRIADATYVIVASTGSSSLSVLRMNDLGVLFPTDHVIDSGATRIDDIQAMDCVTINGRSLIVAAGSDAGVSVFEVLPGGKLSHLFATPFETAPGLAAVTGIEARVIGNDLAVFLTDATGGRVHHLAWDITGFGGMQIAAPGGGEMRGTNLDDRLIGGSGADAIRGGAGADLIHDGGGSDQLTGDAGADVFVFAQDGQVDRVTDFEMGIDRIDISDWGRIYSAESLTITTTSTGAEITYGGEKLILISSSGTGIDASRFTDADFLFQ